MRIDYAKRYSELLNEIKPEKKHSELFSIVTTIIFLAKQEERERILKLIK
jgi:hypothetical protein